MTGPVTTGDLGDGESDPSSASCDIAFPVAVNEYITDELGFQTDRPYVVQSDEVNKKWKFGLDNQSISQENTIYEAMSKNPFLKVWVLCGYYDAATPFYAAEWVYDHVFINDRLQDNLSFTYYPSGHMIYVNADSLVQLHQDAEAWFPRLFASVRKRMSGNYLCRLRSRRTIVRSAAVSSLLPRSYSFLRSVF